jgi:hypothetical protein
MPELLAALAAFLQEHRCCDELDGGTEKGTPGVSCAGGGDNQCCP